MANVLSLMNVCRETLFCLCCTQRTMALLILTALLASNNAMPLLTPPLLWTDNGMN